MQFTLCSKLYRINQIYLQLGTVRSGTVGWSLGVRSYIGWSPLCNVLGCWLAKSLARVPMKMQWCHVGAFYKEVLSCITEIFSIVHLLGILHRRSASSNQDKDDVLQYHLDIGFFKTSIDAHRISGWSIILFSAFPSNPRPLNLKNITTQICEVLRAFALNLKWLL